MMLVGDFFSTCFRFGFGVSSDQDQVLRNQSVGSTVSSAASGPRLVMPTAMRISSGPSLAYSTTTSK